jgi:uncharacterized membrane protein
MENKTCSHCGFIAQQSAEFCVSCGRELPSSAAEDHKSFKAPENQLYSIQPFTGIGAVINPTLRIFTKNFWFISKLVFVIFAPLEIITILGVGEANYSWQNVIGAGFLWLLCNALIAPSLIYALVTQMQTGITPSLHESYRWGLRKLLPFIACVALAWFLTALGFALLIIPGVILGVAFGLVYPMASLENGSPVEILKRSYNLTKGYRWNIFAATLVLGMLCAAVSFPINAVSTILTVSGSAFWPVQVALAIIVDIISEATTVLALVIYLSILSTAVRRETSENFSVTYER